MYKQRRLLSQNFLINRELVSQLVRNSSISPRDLVLEIGPGTGNLTTALLSTSCRLIAVEKDVRLYQQLRCRFSREPRLNLVCRDILSFPLPFETYKVFANIPFGITGQITKKLLFSPQPPTDSYLVMQLEAASKLLSSSHHYSLISVLVYPWFEITIQHRFCRQDFSPMPQVDSCLLHIRQRANPLLPPSARTSYRDFIVYHFTHSPLAKYIPPASWPKLFRPLAQARGAFTYWLRYQSHWQHRQ